MPKGVGCASYKSFVFNEWRGDWSDGFYLIRGTWLTSAKSGGFRPVGKLRSVLEVQLGCGYLFKNSSMRYGQSIISASSILGKKRIWRYPPPRLKGLTGAGSAKSVCKTLSAWELEVKILITNNLRCIRR